MGEPNVLDVVWVLSEETGQLMYESFAVVAKRPKQRIILSGGEGISKALYERYMRIKQDRFERGIRDG